MEYGYEAPGRPPRPLPPRPSRSRARFVLTGIGVLAALAAVVIAFVFLFTDTSNPASFKAPNRPVTATFQPFSYAKERENEFASRAAAGHAHPLYAVTPDGPVVAAERTASFRKKIDRVAEEHDLDPETIEAMVLLESAGRTDAMAGGDPENAAGLTQIIPDTATSILDMRVDLARSRALTRAIARADRAGAVERAKRLRAQRAKVDQRFDPDAALAGTARYLVAARNIFGRDDLAVVAYHMGFGNLEAVLRDIADDSPDKPVADIVREHDLSWPRVFFTAGPKTDRDAYLRLGELGDDSPTYYWRVLAAKELMKRWRDDPIKLAEYTRRHREKASHEEVLHPREATTIYETPEDIEKAVNDGELVPIPAAKALFIRKSRGIGELAGRLEREPELYHALRPEAAATLIFIARQVRRLSGVDAPLVVTSGVRDRKYQDILSAQNIEATPDYSLHTTGWAFDIARSYRSPRQAAAFQHMLDQLEALNLIAWVREGEAIHITVGPDAKAFLPLLRQAGYEGVET